MVGGRHGDGAAQPGGQRVGRGGDLDRGRGDVAVVDLGGGAGHPHVVEQVGLGRPHGLDHVAQLGADGCGVDVRGDEHERGAVGLGGGHERRRRPRRPCSRRS